MIFLFVYFRFYLFMLIEVPLPRGVRCRGVWGCGLHASRIFNMTVTSGSCYEIIAALKNTDVFGSRSRMQSVRKKPASHPHLARVRQWKQL